MLSQVSVTAAEVLMSHPSRGQSPVFSTTTTGWTPILQTASVHPVSSVNNLTFTIGANTNDHSNPQLSAEVFPCLHPINPHMRDSENRLQTFVDRAASWPKHSSIELHRGQLIVLTRHREKLSKLVFTIWVSLFVLNNLITNSSLRH